MFLPLNGAGSLLEIDEQLRLPWVQKYFGGRVSDTHMVRVLSGLKANGIRGMNYRMCIAGNYTYQLGNKH
ncbi:MAG: hypothetical protein AB1765_12530, partial [Candidatus Hydrogenedentota bacterium]